jgi:hypothetical protein
MPVTVTVTVETVKMPRYANSEFADMNFVYGFCDGHSLAALRVSGDNCTNMCLKYKHSPVACMCCPGAMCGDEEYVLDIVHDNPSASTHQISSATQLAQSVLWHTLKESQLYPFHVF